MFLNDLKKLFKKTNINKINIFNFWIYTFFLLTITLGITFRSVEILNQNYLFGFDQGRDYLTVRNIVENKKLTLIGSELGAGAAGLNGIFHGPFHFYFLSIPYLIFDGDPYGGMILTYFYGIITLILIFVIGKNLFGKMAGLFALSLAAISPPLISQSRFIWNSHGAPVFVLLTIFYVYKICQKTSSRNIFLASFFAAFIYNFQLAIAVPMCITLIVLLIFILKVRDLKSYFALILGFVVGFLPMILFELRHNFLGIRGLLNYIINSNEINNPGFLSTISNHFPSFVSNINNSFIKQDFLNEVLLSILLIFFLFYCVFKEKNKILKKFISYLMSVVLITIIVLGFLNNNVWDYYLLHLVVIYIIFLVYIVISSYERKQYYLLVIIFLFLSISLIRLIPNLVKNIKYDYKDYGGVHKIKGKIDAIDFVYKDANGKDFGFFVSLIFSNPHEYLIEWYANKKYGYKPSKSFDGTFYLLIDENPSNTLLQEYWLKKEIKEGKIIFNKKVKTGFVVQKRISEIK